MTTTYERIRQDDKVEGGQEGKREGRLVGQREVRQDTAAGRAS
jgi:hypothetical protein